MNSLLHSIKQNSPTLLTLIGGVGVLVTGVLAGVATYKACKMVHPEDLKTAIKDEETRKDIVKCYIPPAVAATVTITAIVSANYIQYRRNSLLAGALAVTGKAYLNYKKHVQEIDPDIDDKAVENMAQEQYEEEKENIIIDTGEKVLFYESFSQRFFWSTWGDFYFAFYAANIELTMNDYCPMNYIFKKLEMEETDTGDVYGFDSWTMAEDGLAPIVEVYPVKKVMDDGQVYYCIKYGFGISNFDNWDDETDMKERK